MESARSSATSSFYSGDGSKRLRDEATAFTCEKRHKRGLYRCYAATCGLRAEGIVNHVPGPLSLESCDTCLFYFPLISGYRSTFPPDQGKYGQNWEIGAPRCPVPRSNNRKT